jgi:hypothetical protein
MRIFIGTLRILTAIGTKGKSLLEVLRGIKEYPNALAALLISGKVNHS